MDVSSTTTIAKRNDKNVSFLLAFNATNVLLVLGR